MLPQSQTALAELAELLRRRNALSRSISTVIGRPASADELRRFIAAAVTGLLLPKDLPTYYDARLEGKASFGSSVRFRWYAHHVGQFDLERYGPPEYFVVVAGDSAEEGGYGTPCSLSIRMIYIMNGKEVHNLFRDRTYKDSRRVQLPPEVWEAAEIYPRQVSPLLTLTEAQRAAIELFRDVEFTL